MPDFDAALAELKSKGVEVVFGPMDSGVCQMAAILDPDGNQVMLHRRHDGTHG